RFSRDWSSDVCSSDLRICCRRMSGGGAMAPAEICSWAWFQRSSNSLLSTTPSSATAMTLSIDTGCATAFACHRPASSRKQMRRSCSERRSFMAAFPVTLDAVVENSDDVAAHDAAQSLELELQEDPAVLLFHPLVKRVVVDPAARQYPHGPATVVVLQPRDGFQIAMV